MMPDRRAFVLLQGPPGPLFHRLGAALKARGKEVYRINICGGDRYDWPGEAIDFRGRFTQWPVFFDKFLRDHQITDMILFGDCRPYHVSAHGMAALRGVRTYVLEEGYIRPHWMTFELEGVNARSQLSRDKTWLRKEALQIRAEPTLPPITASFRRRARDSYWHYHHVVTGLLRFPHYRSHRPDSIILEGVGWLWKFLRAARQAKKAERALKSLARRKVFLLPLQLSGDYQIRAHSPFPDMQSAASYVIESFAVHAGPDQHLLLKLHPLDPSFFNWRRFVAQHARRLGLEGRLHFINGGDLEDMVKTATGLVCVNSTSATLALARGVPVCTLGEAIYDIVGLTHQRHLDTFWRDPTPPEPGLYACFQRVLVDRCLVRGGLSSESAVSILVESMIDRLHCNDEYEAIPPQSESAVPNLAAGNVEGASTAWIGRRSPGAQSRG